MAETRAENFRLKSEIDSLKEKITYLANSYLVDGSQLVVTRTLEETTELYKYLTNLILYGLKRLNDVMSPNLKLVSFGQST